MLAAKTTLPGARRPGHLDDTCRGSTRCSPSCRCRRRAGRHLRHRRGGRAERGPLRRGASWRSGDPALAARLEAFRAAQTERVLEPEAAGAGVILPGATVGMLGGGQLGRMFTLRARSMGYRVVVLDPDPAKPGGPRRRPAPPRRVHRRARARRAGRGMRGASRPSSRTCRRQRSSGSRGRDSCDRRSAAVAIAQDRIAEKSFLQRVRVRHGRVPRRCATAGARDGAAADPLARAAQDQPARVRWQGPGDGRPTRRRRRSAFERFGRVPCVLEERLTLEAELSVVLARGEDGADGRVSSRVRIGTATASSRPP